MINVTEVEATYFRCQSCFASKEKDKTDIFNISIGTNENHTSSFRLCVTCMYQLRVKTQSALKE